MELSNAVIDRSNKMTPSFLENILAGINLHRQNQLILDKIQAPKNTARARTTLHVHDDRRNYLIEIATNPIQQYYLKKNIEWPQKHLVPNHNIKYLTPVWHGSLDNASCAIYQHANILGFYNKQSPNFLNGFSTQSKTLKMRAEVLDRITDGFLSGWPPSFHDHIRRLDLFQEWRFLNSQEPSVTLVNEHGDYAPNNILVTPNGPLLIDFEFAKTDQIDGYDLFYNETIRKVVHSERNASKRKLHQCKLALCNSINDDLDFDRAGVIFHVPRSSQQGTQYVDSAPWIEILDYPGAPSIKLMRCSRGITLSNSDEALASRRALEALPANIAKKLASRWNHEKVLLYAMEMAVGCAVSQALLRYRLPSLICNARSASEGLKLLSRLLRGKLYFSWHKKLKGDTYRHVIYHGNLKHYLMHLV
jgi:hypothetical protein